MVGPSMIAKTGESMRRLLGIGKPAITLAIEVVDGGTTTRAPRKAD